MAAPPDACVATIELYPSRGESSVIGGAITAMFCNFARRWPGDAAAINLAGKLRTSSSNSH
jgi:hypothetical protein